MADGIAFRTLRSLSLVSILLVIGCSSTVDKREQPTYLDPQMDSIPEMFDLEYSWSGGFGSGDVYLFINKNGVGKLIAKSVSGKEEIYFMRLPIEKVANIFALVDSERFKNMEMKNRTMCQSDIGTFKIRFVNEPEGKEVFVSETEINSDPAFFGEIIDKIMELTPSVGSQLRWGPRGTTSYQC